MNAIRRKTVLGRWNRLTAGGVCLSALGLAGLFLALAGGWHGGNLAVFVIEAAGGLTLLTIGFVLMVLGSDPFADDEGRPMPDDVLVAGAHTAGRKGNEITSARRTSEPNDARETSETGEPLARSLIPRHDPPGHRSPD